jgi:Acetyltransferases
LGYGKILLDYLLNKLKEHNVKVCYLEVSSKNSRAINLYKKFGFMNMVIEKSIIQA